MLPLLLTTTTMTIVAAKDDHNDDGHDDDRDAAAFANGYDAHDGVIGNNDAGDLSADNNCHH